VRTSRRVALALGALGAVLAATACGNGGGSAPTTTASGGAASTEQQIAHNWTAFFSGDTSASEKEALLQNGSRFASVIESQAGSSLAKRTSAKVQSVTVQGPATARVKYTILLGGQPVLTNRTGTAVRENGTWKVGDASFCQLLGLQGALPSACPSG